MIDYQYNSRYHYYFINWVVIRGLAKLKNPLEVGGREHSNFKRMDQRVFLSHPEHWRRMAEQKKTLKHFIGRISKDTPETWKRFLLVVSRWTAEKYTMIVDALIKATHTEQKLLIEEMPKRKYQLKQPEARFQSCAPISSENIEKLMLETRQIEPLPF